MADFNLKIKAEQLGIDFENLGEALEARLHEDIAELARVTHEMIAAKAHNMLTSTAKDYALGLKLDTIGENAYLISLTGDWANLLETGFPPYDMRDKLLNSKSSVSAGPRAGEPWVQKRSDGGKFAHVPFEHQPYSKAPKAAGLAEAMESILVRNRQNELQEITKTFKDSLGRPLSGKVARAEDTGIPELEGLTKFQKVYPESGKVSSIYMTWRTISEGNGSGWQHPGFEGVQAFEEAEKFVEEQFDNILNDLSKNL